MRIIWLTGESGAGKTTLAKRLQEDWPCIILDGNEMRASISEGAGFSTDDRAEHNFRVARLARVLSKQMNVVVAVITVLILSALAAGLLYINEHFGIGAMWAASICGFLIALVFAFRFDANQSRK